MNNNQNPWHLLDYYTSLEYYLKYTEVKTLTPVLNRKGETVYVRSKTEPVVSSSAFDSLKDKSLLLKREVSLLYFTTAPKEERNKFMPELFKRGVFKAEDTWIFKQSLTKRLESYLKKHMPSEGEERVARMVLMVMFSNHNWQVTSRLQKEVPREYQGKFFHRSHTNTLYEIKFKEKNHFRQHKYSSLSLRKEQGDNYTGPFLEEYSKVTSILEWVRFFDPTYSPSLPVSTDREYIKAHQEWEQSFYRNTQETEFITLIKPFTHIPKDNHRENLRSLLNFLCREQQNSSQVLSSKSKNSLSSNYANWTFYSYYQDLFKTPIFEYKNLNQISSLSASESKALCLLRYRANRFLFSHNEKTRLFYGIELILAQKGASHLNAMELEDVLATLKVIRRNYQDHGYSMGQIFPSGKEQRVVTTDLENLIQDLENSYLRIKRMNHSSSRVRLKGVFNL